MGSIKHHTLVFIGTGSDLEIAHSKAAEKMGSLVSGIVESYKNGYKSFFVAPDGSKEGWDISNECDLKRKELCDFVDSLQNDWGSNNVTFVEVSIDEDNENRTVIERVNRDKHA